MHIGVKDASLLDGEEGNGVLLPELELFERRRARRFQERWSPSQDSMAALHSSPESKSATQAEEALGIPGVHSGHRLSLG